MLPRRAVERTDRFFPTRLAGEAAASGNIPEISDRERRCWRSRETDQAESRRFLDGQEARSQARRLRAPPEFHPGRHAHTATWLSQASGIRVAQHGSRGSVLSSISEWDSSLRSDLLHKRFHSARG